MIYLYFNKKGIKMSTKAETKYPQYNIAINQLYAARDTWAQTSIAERIQILKDIKDALLSVSKTWVETSGIQKQLPKNSILLGEEWLGGPYALMTECNNLIYTLGKMTGKSFLNSLPTRVTANGQLAVKVAPHTIWDRLLLSGVSAEVWMQPHITKDNLAENTASQYDKPASERKGKVSLILGAGNVAAIAPMDCFQKLFLEHQVVILKMNPVNDYLAEYLEIALKPLIDRDFLRIVKGDGAAGAYLTNHPLIEELHITGATLTHDAIIWGVGAAGKANKKAGKPNNSRRITSELGAVCPTIVVPGPWTRTDIDFQAQHIATQKLHNSGFNCIACQMLVLSEDWDKRASLMTEIKGYIAKSNRPAYYPHTQKRLDTFASHSDNVIHINRDNAPDLLVTDTKDSSWFGKNEVFAPAMSTHTISESDPEKYLIQAISYANTTLHGSLGANILIHPKTIRKIGKKRFETIISELHYGCIAINAWSALGFLLSQTPWGAFPGHTLEDVQSGIGTVHNTLMFDHPERTIIQAPWRPFPRSILSGEFTLLPKPPWFITNKKQHKIGMLLTQFQHSPSWLKIPRIIANAVLG